MPRDAAPFTVLAGTARPLRAARRAGNAYWVPLRTGRSLYARIADDQARVGGMDGMYVLYVYDHLYDGDQRGQVQAHALDDLLFPPLMVNRACWTGGVLEPAVAVAPLEAHPVHAFAHPLSGRVFDARGQELTRVPHGVPVGVLSVHLPLGLDEQVATALAT